MVETAFGVESPTYVAIRLALSVCAVSLLGILTLRWTVLGRYAGPDGAALRTAVEAQLPRWIGAIGAAALIATLARLVAQHAAVFGSDAILAGPSLGALLFRSSWGRAWWLAAGSAMAIMWLAARLRRPTAAAWIALALAILLFTMSQPWSGHPAAADRPWLAIGWQTLHVVGAGGWIGSLALLTALAIPIARQLTSDVPDAADVRTAALVRAFSPTALACSGVLVGTGILTAWSNLGGATALWHSTYGRTLLLKLLLLGVTAGFGAYHWQRVLPVLGTAKASAMLRRSSLLELGAAGLVLAVSAVLVATPMPGE
jgi:putative copper export protein